MYQIDSQVLDAVQPEDHDSRSLIQAIYLCLFAEQSGRQNASPYKAFSELN